MAKFGMLFQGGALFDSLPVWANVAFGLMQAQGMAAADAKEIALDKLAQVGLDAEVAPLFPAGLIGRHAKTRRPCARHCPHAGNNIF
jgi:phospholipid/cholesterol/gamma-HCH transport system ATP-binding protein